MSEYFWLLHLNDGSFHRGPREGGFSSFETEQMDRLEIVSGGRVFVVELGNGRRPIIVRRVVRALVTPENEPGRVLAWGFGWAKALPDGSNERSICWLAGDRIILTDRDLSAQEVE